MAYEMRISDWSSDVCAAELRTRRVAALRADPRFPLFDRQHFDGDRHIAVIDAAQFRTLAVIDADLVRGERRFVGAARHRVHLAIGRASGRDRLCQYV